MSSASPAARHSSARAGIGPSIAGGLLLTVLFYAAIPYLPAYRDFAERYFCGHPLEYITTVASFIAIAMLAGRRFGLGREREACRVVTAAAREASGTDARGIELVADVLRAVPPRLRNTIAGRRFVDLDDFVRGSDADGAAEHLRYLAELAADRSHAAFAPLRTITWAVPILGFLGTVMGITVAIANIDPKQLGDSVGDVTGGLAVAFDTTALALCWSLLLVFASAAVERAERGLLDDVEEAGLLLAGRLSSETSKDTPEAIVAAGVEDLVARQLAFWDETFTKLGREWTTALADQHDALAATLADATDDTLTTHRDALASARTDLIDRFDRSVATASSAIDRVVARQAAAERAQTERTERLWAEVRQTIRHAGEQVIAHQQTVERQSASLASLLEAEKDLARLQGLLAQNLEALRASDTYEQSLHSLTAAAHLLTAKAGPKAA